jgi:PhzF family phenazine biosynthesis protein
MKMTTYPFTQLDVFSAQPLRGNPLAVVHQADTLVESQMQSFAKWANLSESTFLMQPTALDADYRVRIFTPGGELPFAGHPTLGSCAAWLSAGGKPKQRDVIVQECGIGLVRVRRSGDRLSFAAPPLVRRGPLDASLLERIIAGLGIQPSMVLAHHWVDNGPGWCAVMLDSAERVLRVRPDPVAVRDLKLGLIGPTRTGAETDFEVRAFVGPLGIAEDPVTGSLNAGLAFWLIPAGLAASSYVVSQGSVLGRAGRVFIDQDGDDIWVGGDVSTCISGHVFL